MKVVCDNCGSKYSIPDEKISGKAFKTRCKKCDSTIVVRGDQISNPPQEETTKIFRSDSGDVWHVVVGEDQQGPFGASKVYALLTAGSIDWGSYVWRESMDGWKPMSQVGELSDALISLGATPPKASGGGSVSDEVDQSFASLESPTSSPSMPSEFPADPSKLASRNSNESGPDLFAEVDQESSTISVGEAKEERSSSPRVSTEDALTGQRNENSVLFSLDSLKKAKTDKGEEKVVEEEKIEAPVKATGPSSDDASGLIDIKALANVAGSANESASSFQSSSGTLDSPLLAAPPEKQKGKGGVFVGALLVLLLLGGGAAALHFMKIIDFSVLVAGSSVSDEPVAQVQPQEVPVQPSVPVEPPTGGEDVSAGTEAEAQPGEGDAVEQKAQNTELVEEKVEEPKVEPKPEKKEEVASSSSNRRRRRGRTSKAPSRVRTQKAPENKPKPSPKKQEKKDIASLMNKAAGVKSGGSSSKSSSLPDTPSRSDVLKGMKGVQRAVSNCGQGSRGIAKVKVTISGSSGRVKKALVSGQFAGTTVGSCIAREVRKARFSKFKQSTFEVSFPFRI